MRRWLSVLPILFSLSFAVGQETQPLTLQQCIEIALKTHPLIRLSYRQLDAALARSEQAKAQWRPELTFTGVQRRQGPTVSFTVPNPLTGMPVSIEIVKRDMRTLTGEIRQSLLSFGRKSASIRSAEFQVNATSATVQAVQAQLILRVTEAYADVLAAQAMEEVARQAVERVKIVLKTAQARYEAGVAPKFDVLRAEAELAAAEEQLLAARNGVALAKAALNQLLGRPTNASIELVSLPEPFDVLPELIQSEPFIKQAMANRPELRSSEWQIRAAEELVKLAKADKNPLVLLTGSYVRQTKTGFAEDYQWGVNLVVQFPIFDSGRRESAVREREATLEQALAQRENLERQIALEVEQAVRNFQVALQRLKTARAALASAEEAFRLAQVRYEGGVGTQVEVWDAQVALTRARANEVQALYDAHKAFARLVYATGLNESEVRKLLKSLSASAQISLDGGER
jgi:outer membrane protein